MKKEFLVVIIVLVAISLNAQNIFDIDRSNNEFVYGQSIKLFLGDSILVEAVINNNKIKEFKVVNSIIDSSRTIKIVFKYDFFGSNKASLLQVTNPFEKTLDYHAQIKLLNRRKYKETSIMPVYPKIYSIEMWPGKLESIILTDFKLN